jgi:hypothetical protein
MYLPLPLTRPNIWPQERLNLLDPIIKDGKIIAYEGSVYHEFQWAKTQGRKWFGRRDILLINVSEKCKCEECGNIHTSQKQYTVEPTKGGLLTTTPCQLPDKDWKWALEESKRCWETALNDPLIMEMFYS